MDINTRRAAAITAALMLAGTLAACGGSGGYSGSESGGDEMVPGADSMEQSDAEAEMDPPVDPDAEVLTGWPDAATLDELMTADVMNVDAIYVDKVRAEYPEQTADLTDDEITTIGHDPCMAFGEGATLEDVTEATVAAGVDLEVGGYIVGGGLAVYCPEYLDLFYPEQ